MVVSAARENLTDFAICVDHEYQDTWFHETLGTLLQWAVEEVEQGRDVRIIIEAPPRHGKSHTSTKIFPSWVLGRHPDWPIIVGSYSAELATEFGQATRDIMQSPEYKMVFSTRLRADTTAKGKWKTNEGGGYTSTGAGGGITGKGFKIGIIDDVFKNREEADSAVIRESRWNWWKSTFYTRQEGASAIIIINTRWHTDDLVGRLVEEQKKNEAAGEKSYDKWKRITFPAIATEDETFRKKGEALWPAKFNVEKLKVIENAIGPYEWSSLYMATPISSSNQEFKESWFKYRKMADVEVLKTRKFATIDPGGKELENDYTGITRNYVDKENNWNIKSIRVHFDAAELINYIFILHDEGFEIIGIEETVFLKAIKPFFEQECRTRNKFPNVIPLKHGGRNKEVRIRGLVPRFSSGSIFFIEGECKDLIDEMLVFPKGAHDDTLDSCAYQNDIAEPPADDYQIAATQHKREERRNAAKKAYGLS